MSTLQSSIASALRDAGIHFTGGTWLRLKGKDYDAISINAVSGGWRDHRTGEHGSFPVLAARLGIDSDLEDPRPTIRPVATRQTPDTPQQWAKTQWARAIPTLKPARPHGWAQAAWDKQQAQYQDARDAVYDYLASRGLDPLPLLPLIRIQPRLTSRGMDAEMQDAGADFAFLIPMYELGKPQIPAHICGIQRTYLQYAADDYHRTTKTGRAMLGKKGVTLIPATRTPITLPTNKSVLGSGEGFENVASFVQAMGHSSVVCWDWIGLKAWSEDIQPTENAPLISILVDYDQSETGQRESAAAVRRIIAKGGQAVYLLPPDSITPDAKGNRDWNDLLRQSCEPDFAAEIINAWHKSDGNLSAAPAPHDEPAPIRHTGPRDADVAQTIADAVARYAASEAMKKGIADYEAAYAAFRVAMLEWSGIEREERNARGLKKPKLPPMLIKVTTGVGKSHQIRDLVRNTKLPLLILTRTHELAHEYAAVGAFQYHGRSEPSIKTEAYSADFVEKNQHEFGASDCFKYPLVKITSQNNHVPALTACRSCEHGRKFMLNNYAPSSEPWQDAQDWFERNQINPDRVPPCLWLGHQMEASHKRIVVAPNASFSDSLATWQTPDRPIPRLVILDEIPDLTREITAHSGDMGNNVANAQKSIEYLQRHHSNDDEEAKAKIVKDLGEAIKSFIEIGKWLGQTLDKGIQQIPDAIVSQIKSLHVDWLPGATARWEKAEIRYGHEPFIPLRMMKAMIESIGTNTATVEKGLLHIQEMTGLGEYVSAAKPSILLDATPSLAVETIVTTKGGQIVQAIARQHINLVHFSQYLHGKSWKNDEHKTSEMLKLQSLREQMTEETGNAKNVLTYMKLCELGDKKDSKDWGYFGRDDVGQDRWKGQDLLVFGGPLFSPTSQAIAYNSELMLMRLAGVKNLPDWSTEIEYNQEITVGDKIITSHAPLPSDPCLREWVLSDYGRRITQSIGRVRGVWAPESKPINVWIAGGLPLAGLAKYGITVNEYRHEKLIDLRDQSHKAALEKVQVAMAALQAADQDPSYRQVNKWLADHGLPSVRYDAWKTIASKASTGSDKDTYQPVDNLLASLNSLQKVAEWSGNNISNVALNTWDAPGIDPEIGIAAEIILEVSPYTDNWRQKKRDG